MVIQVVLAVGIILWILSYVTDALRQGYCDLVVTSPIVPAIASGVCIKPDTAARNIPSGVVRDDTLDGFYSTGPSIWDYLDNLNHIQENIGLAQGIEQFHDADRQLLSVLGFRDIYAEAARDAEALEPTLCANSEPFRTTSTYAQQTNKDLEAILENTHKQIQDCQNKIPPDPSDGILSALFNIEVNDFRRVLDNELKAMPVRDDQSEDLFASATMWGATSDTIENLVLGSGATLTGELRWLEEKVQRLAADREMLRKGRQNRTKEEWEKKLNEAIKRCWVVSTEWRTRLKAYFTAEKVDNCYMFKRLGWEQRPFHVSCDNYLFCINSPASWLPHQKPEEVPNERLMPQAPLSLFFVCLGLCDLGEYDRQTNKSDNLEASWLVLFVSYPSRFRLCNSRVLCLPRLFRTRILTLDVTFINASDPDSIARASVEPSSAIAPHQQLRPASALGVPIRSRPAPPAPSVPTPTPTEIENSLRRQAVELKRQEDTAWLNDAWGGPDWLPADLRNGLSSFGFTKPAALVVATLKKITQWAQEHSIDLDSLWREGGALHEAVSRDQTDRAKRSKPRSRPLKPHLTVALAKGALKALRQPNRQLQSAPSIDESRGSFIEQEREDSPVDTQPRTCSTPTAASASPDTTTFTMSDATSNTHMDIDLPTAPAIKRRSSVSSLSSSHVSKRQRTLAFDAANHIIKALSTSSMMRSDVMGILGRLLSMKAHGQTDPATIRWIDPLCLQRDTSPQPVQLTTLQHDRPVAIAIFTTHPFEHWSFGILRPNGQDLELRLHDCQPSEERSKLIESRFQKWMPSCKIVLATETCPRLHGDNWSSGLHALSCFQRSLRNEPCSPTIPVVAATEQKTCLDLLGNAVPDSLNTEDGQVLTAVQVRKVDSELANMAVEEVDRQRTKAKAELQDAKKRKESQDEFLDKMIEDLLRKKQQHQQEVQSAQMRADNVERVYQGKLTLAAKEKSALLSNEAGDRVRQLQEELERANAEHKQRQAEHQEAADKHDDSMVETGDWQVHLDAVNGLYGHDGEEQ
ncbi:hypothetical protein FDECE_13236 [Fusarium decemcellulare]|nr:hypothetical protein FDECE_13236 [Fusarium decemcellulare]